MLRDRLTGMGTGELSKRQFRTCTSGSVGESRGHTSASLIVEDVRQEGDLDDAGSKKRPNKMRRVRPSGASEETSDASEERRKLYEISVINPASFGNVQELNLPSEWLTPFASVPYIQDGRRNTVLGLAFDN